MGLVLQAMHTTAPGGGDDSLRLATGEALVDRLDRQAETTPQLIGKALGQAGGLGDAAVFVERAPHHKPVGLPGADQFGDARKALISGRAVDQRERPCGGAQGVAQRHTNVPYTEIEGEQGLGPSLWR